MPEKQVHEFGPYRLDVALSRLERAGAAIPLPPKAFDLLVLLARSPDRIIGKSELIEALWPNTFVDDANLTQHVYTLRKALARANLAEGMKWLLGTYTCRFNRKHKLFGHLFSGRYKAKPVDAGGTGYLKSACDYVHLNPVRAGLLSPEQPLQSYRWSSYPLYLLLPESRPRFRVAEC